MLLPKLWQHPLKGLNYCCKRNRITPSSEKIHTKALETVFLDVSKKKEPCPSGEETGQMFSDISLPRPSTSVLKMPSTEVYYMELIPTLKGPHIS